LDETVAREISARRYEPPFDVYNPAPDAMEPCVQTLLDPADQLLLAYRIRS
jgi:hypothetical protein